MAKQPPDNLTTEVLRIVGESPTPMRTQDVYPLSKHAGNVKDVARALKHHFDKEHVTRISASSFYVYTITAAGRAYLGNPAAQSAAATQLASGDSLALDAPYESVARELDTPYASALPKPADTAGNAIAARDPAPPTANPPATTIADVARKHVTKPAASKPPRAPAKKTPAASKPPRAPAKKTPAAPKAQDSTPPTAVEPPDVGLSFAGVASAFLAQVDAIATPAERAAMRASDRPSELSSALDIGARLAATVIAVWPMPLTSMPVVLRAHLRDALAPLIEGA